MFVESLEGGGGGGGGGRLTSKKGSVRGIGGLVGDRIHAIERVHRGDDLGGEEFARCVFLNADRNGDASLTKSEIKKYFNNHPIEKAHMMGPGFTWEVFFSSMVRVGLWT
jgi:hypothetical protein